MVNSHRVGNLSHLRAGLRWRGVMHFKGDTYRTEGPTCSITPVFTYPVAGHAYDTSWEGLPSHGNWMYAGVRRPRMEHGPLVVAFVHTVPPVGARSQAGSLAVILGLLLVPRLTLMMVVRISCYPLSMSNVIPSFVVPTGMGPNPAAPPFFVNLPATAGKWIGRHADTARAQLEAAAATLAHAWFLEEAMLAGTMNLSRRTPRKGAIDAAACLQG